MTTTVPTPLLRLAAQATDLEDWGPLEEATDGVMTTSGTTLWTGEDGAEAGIWECTPGPSAWALETNEVIHVLSGRMTVTPDGGDAREVAAGDVAVFPVGWTGTWVIHETLRKVYVLF